MEKSGPSRRAHNAEVAGSNPAGATDEEDVFAYPPGSLGAEFERLAAEARTLGRPDLAAKVELEQERLRRSIPAQLEEAGAITAEQREQMEESDRHLGWKREEAIPFRAAALAASADIAAHQWQLSCGHAIMMLEHDRRDEPPRRPRMCPICGRSRDVVGAAL